MGTHGVTHPSSVPLPFQQRNERSVTAATFVGMTGLGLRAAAAGGRRLRRLLAKQATTTAATMML